MRDHPTIPVWPSARIAVPVLLLAVLSGPLATQQPADTSQAFRDSVTVRQKAIDAGRQVFRGGGTCFGCHGPNLEGTAMAPTLRAHKWRNGDGSLDMITRVIRSGVPKTAMISHPGGINDVQLEQVAAYVWAVSRGAVKP